MEHQKDGKIKGDNEISTLEECEDYASNVWW